ncbi:MAG TPA: 50S ribosomal protein L25/general stress protein Ctc [Bacteroidales bacterium]|nr:50S ribosomal protein L25/general stress protein Ctc [Bacteroidales bacterium]HRR04182.1 50S ribosomal protein L25/general stress protein Ctc [Bacteroidales bacterium]HRT13223.1 50S ribosomal protein L25/general stress protein Ctc [Bacteroidales bacterium]HXK73458.1 50S ribosomal protein L25/general stress protein Ctc [Bacteroidales bacterium]
MKSVSISGSLRENVGKKDAKAQRSKGLIPCVLYGGEQQYQFVVPEKQFQKLLYTPEVRYVELELEGKTRNAIVQDTQFHPITDKLLHVDFLEIIPGKPITIAIPVIVTGTSPGVLRGGKMSKKVRKLNVKGELEHIPEHIMLDVSKLDINDSIKVADIEVENLTIMEKKSKVLLTISLTRTTVTEEEQEQVEEAGEQQQQQQEQE